MRLKAKKLIFLILTTVFFIVNTASAELLKRPTLQ